MKTNEIQELEWPDGMKPFIAEELDKVLDEIIRVVGIPSSLLVGVDSLDTETKMQSAGRFGCLSSYGYGDEDAIRRTIRMFEQLWILVRRNSRYLA